jgi:hypothetical protein
MDEKPRDKQQEDNPYTQEEYERDLAHSDVVLAYQKKLTGQLGRPVTLAEAEDVAYGWTGTTESRTAELRRKYASAQSPDGSSPSESHDSRKIG